MEVIIKRSSRRQKTIQARVVDGVIEMLVPASATDAELEPHIKKLQSRLEKKVARSREGRDDAYLERRARFLNQKYFQGALSWKSITYSDRQARRRGSCTPTDRTIRISNRLQKAPRWVEDYVIVHELAHLLEPNHGHRFKALVRRYPLSERAIGFLMAVEMMDRRREG
ncbi:MAG: M48 family metallopeptidase [Methanosarcinales archaeon]|nr:M48 family metallopeptidase [Methanosarcinales archaeon]